MSDFQDLAKRYIETWNETDGERRRRLIEDLYTEDGSYTDPLVEAVGWDVIDQTLGAVQQQFAGLEFSLAGDVDGHHDTARFTWHLAAPGAEEPLVIGFDVIVTDNGKVRRVYGFLDKVPGA
jgi:hypothetical protein